MEKRGPRSNKASKTLKVYGPSNLRITRKISGYVPAK